jgi:hypothetical protein
MHSVMVNFVNAGAVKVTLRHLNIFLCVFSSLTARLRLNPPREIRTLRPPSASKSVLGRPYFTGVLISP